MGIPVTSAGSSLKTHGNFPGDMIISEGIDLHDSEITDLDGDRDLDIMGNPFDGNAQGLDIWLCK